MNIQAIRPSFSGSNFNVDNIIYADDEQLRKIAYYQTQENFNEKKSRRVTNGLFYAAPLAAGLAQAVLGDGKTKLFSKELTGIAGRLGSGLKTAAGFTAVLGAIDLLSLGFNKLVNKSDKAKEFVKEHPFVTLGGLIATGLGVVFGMNKGISKLAKFNAPKLLQNATEKVAGFLNTNKFIGSVKNALVGLAAKTPVVLKDIGKGALDYAPTALLFGGLFHSIASSGAKNREFAKNYNELRNLQSDITKQKLTELSSDNEQLYNDYLEALQDNYVM